MKKTSLPSDPECHPVTDSVSPFGSVPVYQSVNAESVRTSPEIHASRTPQLPASGVVRSGRGRRCGDAWAGRAGSGVCTGAVWAQTEPGALLARLSEDEGAVEQVGVRLEESGMPWATALEVTLDDSGLVGCAVAGTETSGDFRCRGCGYGAVVYRTLPQCPMCSGTVWESLGTPPSATRD
jgi:hypothetical protein